MRKIVSILFICASTIVFAQNNAQQGCAGVSAYPITNTTQFAMAGIPDTVYLPVSGSISIRANYNYNCKLIITNMIIDWIRNDTLIASGTPTYNIGANGYSLLTINTPGIYKTFFNGYYFSPTDGGTQLLYVLKSQVTAITNTMGINNSAEENFTIYPNPANNYLNIDFKNTGNNGEIDIYNSIGEKVRSQSFSENKVKMDINELAKGIYFVKINSKEGNSKALKLIKE